MIWEKCHIHTDVHFRFKCVQSSLQIQGKKVLIKGQLLSQLYSVSAEAKHKKYS